MPDNDEADVTQRAGDYEALRRRVQALEAVLDAAKGLWAGVVPDPQQPGRVLVAKPLLDALHTALTAADAF